MPKIPIQFNYGQYTDVDRYYNERDVTNCYPFTSAGKNPKTIVRGSEGYLKLTDNIPNIFLGSIVVGDFAYVVAGSNFYKVSMQTFVVTAIGSVGITSQPILATNGDTIVIVFPNVTAPSADYYYDIGTATLATIISKDANYAGYGKALDVVYKDGYYVFVTESNIFHGDSFLATGDGLAFNPLSFAPLPSASLKGTGLAVASSQIYVFSTSKTFSYQTASTTPFSFQRSLSFDLDLGLNNPTGKVVFNDRVVLLGRSVNSRLSMYLLEGGSYRNISNTKLDNRLIAARNRALMSAYSINGHVFVSLAFSRASGSPRSPIHLDITESDIVGYPIFHDKAWVAENSGHSKNTQFPIQQYISPVDNTYDEQTYLYAFGGEGDAINPTCLYRVIEDYSMPNPDFFDITEVTPIDNSSVYTFNPVGAESDPFKIRKVRMKFSENTKGAELFIRRIGEIPLIAYESLGYIDLETSRTKVAEWRRINRFSEDIQFKVAFKPIDITRPNTLIEGYFEA